MASNEKLLLAADNDRDMLEYLNEACDEQVYVCENCGHEEPLSTFDIASELRDYERSRAAQPVAVDGMPESTHWSCENDEGETVLIDRWDVAKHMPGKCESLYSRDAFTAWMSKATYKFEIARHSKRLVEQLRSENDSANSRLHEVAVACATAEQERDALRAEMNSYVVEALAQTQSNLELRAEVERLKGLQPGLPPFPPEGEGLPRYGLRWNGPQQPLATPMDDGYWTPWHLADALLASAGGGE